jgi:hypothetical protein
MGTDMTGAYVKWAWEAAAMLLVSIGASAAAAAPETAQAQRATAAAPETAQAQAQRATPVVRPAEPLPLKPSTTWSARTKALAVTGSRKTLVIAARPEVASASPSPTVTDKQQVVSLAKVPLRSFLLKRDKSASAVNMAVAPVELEKEELLLSRTGAEARTLPTGEATREGATPLLLPYEMHFLDPKTGQARNCQLIAEIGVGGFRVEKTGRSFEAEIYVALKDRIEGWTSYELPQPVEILITAAVDSLKPRILSLQKTNQWATIALGVLVPQNEVPVRVRATVDERELELKIPVTRPQLSLLLNPEEIQGFGLDSSKVAIRAEGLPNPAGRVITLVASAGRLEDTRLELDAEGTAVTELRSVGTGAARVSAHGNSLLGGTATVRYAWPVAFLVSALLGALVGALASFLRKSGPMGRRPSHVLMELGAGVLTGLVVAVAYATGVNLLSIDFPSVGGEALVFTAAALGAFGLATRLTPHTSVRPDAHTEQAKA